MRNLKRIRVGMMGLWLCVVGMVGAAPSITEEIFPQYIQGINGTNNDRIPFVYRATLSGLTPSATYYYFNQCVISSTSSTSNGFGNVIFPNESGSFIRTSGPTFSSSGNYGTFTTNSGGSYTGWFISEPTGNAGFTPGNQVFMRINLNDGAGTTTVVNRVTTSQYTTVLQWGATASSTYGTGVIGVSVFAAKSYVFLYDNETGTGRPIAGGLVENDGLDLPNANYVDFHDSSVDAFDNRFGTIIPNVLSTGIQRIEGRAADGSISSYYTSSSGVWAATGANTVNPNGGKTSPLTIQVGLPDDPNIYISPTTLYFHAASTMTNASGQVSINNNGASANLNVTTATLSGPGASSFYVQTPLPSSIAPGTSPTLTVFFTPNGSTALTSATLNIVSNDQSGDIPTVALWGKAAPDLSGYSGLLISEVASQPTAGEFIEIINVSGITINLGDVILSDEDNNNSEGAVSFPTGTSIASGEAIVVAVNNSSTEPAWLDTLPVGVRVFYEPARNVSTWTPANGNSLIAMNDYPLALGGTSDVISLSSGDGAALYAPGTLFVAGIGPFPSTATIDGMNYPQGDSGPSCPINSTGLLDTSSTKAGSSQPASGNSLTRLDASTNANSYLEFTETAISPGSSSLIAPTPSPTPVETPNSVMEWRIH